MATAPSRFYRNAARPLQALMTSVTRKDWHGAEHLPSDTGYIAVSNHVTYADPITLAHFLYNNGQVVRFLAKSSLFSAPVIGAALRGFDQIPVYRGTARAKEAVDKGVEVLERGDMIAMFPEGTLTRDPDLWPMAGRTGVARMALETGVPVIPVAQWGAHRLLGRYEKVPHPFPRKTITVVAGPPVDLDEFRARVAGGKVDTETLRAATDRIMATLTSMVAEIRGETPPKKPYDMRAQGEKR
ncbi:lysophospholipid acyltransferase family protein [Demequina sp. SYSU T00068]|uniref:lysophospholipid acyltransferase family protein n=1 Tax=Demequina lignilytica TaxID=3051663 RepID=UPI002601BEE5|nr:lysophospholipid acyltransferase family protein [Demequina sp. SYSU T00068]MDN4489862.1 lysophospholipid acyltransferase family protein [Demequina sp. SYSU T00068]